MAADLRIEYMPVDALTPYERNARRHGSEDIQAIAASIEAFGFSDPIGVWGPRNVIVEGHGRLEAAKRLGMTEVPCIRLDHLTDEQRKAYTLAHNRTAELSEWDFPSVMDELDDIATVDMSAFRFDDMLDAAEAEAEAAEERHERYKEAERDADANILKLERAQYEGVGKWGIPQLEPVTDLPEVREWIGFNYVLSDKEPAGKGVHFFLNDYQFERIWNNPDAYVDRLRQYAAVATPDFSPYADMPPAAMLWNHYRKHWVGKYLQERGVTIIPTLRPSANPVQLEWWLDGEPEGGAVMISSMWVNTDQDRASFMERYTEFTERLHPNKIFCYGKVPEGADCIRVETFSERRWGNGRS